MKIFKKNREKRKSKKNRSGLLEELDKFQTRIDDYDNTILSLENYSDLQLFYYAQFIKKKFEILDHLESINTKDCENEIDLIKSKLDFNGDIEKFSNLYFEDNLCDIRGFIKGSTFSKINSILEHITKKTKLIKKYGEPLGIKLSNGEYTIGMSIQQITNCLGEPNTTKKEIPEDHLTYEYIWKTFNKIDSKKIFKFEDNTLISIKEFEYTRTIY